MDYILTKINDDLDISIEDSIDQCTLLKERVEYSLIVAMGYLYNKNIKALDLEKMKKVNDNFINMTFGKTIENIRLLDLYEEFWENKKKKIELLNDYSNIRNEYIGHGYIHSDGTQKLKEEFYNYYKQLQDRIGWFKEEKEYILITGKDDNNYLGIRFDNKNRKNQWICPRTILGEEYNEIKEDEVFLLIKGQYYKISPFIIIENKGNAIYLFSSLKDIRTGEIKLNRLLDTEEPKKIVYPMFVRDYNQNELYKASSEGTIMNNFTLNYKNYMETPVEKDIFEYLGKNTSNVQATLWGHGGVGKTAAVQYVCERIFHGECGAECKFKYIVFTTAKDRRFDPKSGNIVKLDNLKTYDDIIKQIMLLVFGETIEENPKSIIESEDKIANIKDKLLLIIDDYETFSDEDKQSIQEFINRLNLNYHRVIITTRNKKLANGIPIQTSEFDEKDTISFFKSIIKNEYPQFEIKANDIVSSKEKCVDIHKATEGRAISIYHFVNLLVQRGFSKELLIELHNSENMSKFLYDRIYSLLSEDAKKVFGCIALLVNKDNLVFSYKIAEFIIEEVISENSFDETIEELLLQKVIEKTNIEHLYRVYTGNILVEMQSRYAQLDQNIKDSIEKKKNQLGGSFEIRSIDEALMAVARKIKISGTYEATKDQYLYIIKTPKISEETRKQAICEYLDYVLLYGKDSRDITDYKKILYSADDEQVKKYYIKGLWNIDKKGKVAAVQLLMKKQTEDVNELNYELISYKILYCITFYSEEYKVTNDSSYKAKIEELLEKTGSKLYKFLPQYCYSRRVDLSNECKDALLLIISISCSIYKNNEYKLKPLKYYIDFCKKHFRGNYYERTIQLEREVIKLFKEMEPAILKKYDRDTLFIATVTKVRNNTIQCKVEPNFIVNLFDVDMGNELKKYDKIFAKIKNISKYNEVEISYEGFVE